MILLFTLRHNLTYKAVSDLLQLLRKILPFPNNVPTSFWQFKSKIKSHCASSPKFNLYCDDCHENLSTDDTHCTSCCCTQVSYFTTLPVQTQLKSLLSSESMLQINMFVMYIGKEIYTALEYRFTRTKKCSSNIEDVYDGTIYKRLGILKDKHALSFKHNTDGISVFRSSGKDVWPVYLQINELPPLMRYNE